MPATYINFTQHEQSGLVLFGTYSNQTFGSYFQIPTGLFIPSLGVGALMGRLMGIAVEQLVYTYPHFPFWSKDCLESQQSCINPGLYAMVGAAATLGEFMFKN